MHADSVLIHVRQCHQFAKPGHLVSHLRLSAVFVDSLLISSATVFRTPVVLHIDDVAALRHIHFPKPYLSKPGIIHHLRMRTAIDIQDDRILLGRVEIHRKIEPVPVVIFSVGALYRSQSHLTCSVILHRILGGEESLGHLSVCRSHFHLAWNIETAVTVDKPCA